MPPARRTLWIATVVFAVVVGATEAAAVTLDGDYATRFSFGVDPDPCVVTVTQVGTALAMSGTGCAFITGGLTFAFTASGTIDPDTGVFSLSGATDIVLCETPGSFTITGIAETDESFAGSFTCQATGTVAGVRTGGPQCGNGAVDPGEECDGSPCCGASCHVSADGTPCAGSAACRTGFACSAGACTPSAVLPSGTSCNTDADLCTPEACDGAGQCLPAGAPLVCGPCAECLPHSGCRTTPPRLLSGTCGAPVTPSAKLAITDKTVTATTSWNLGRGPAIATADFGDPTTVTDWELCVFAVGEPGFDPVLAVAAPAGAGWRPAKGGFRFQQDDATGRTVIQLKPGVAGRSKVKAKRKGALPIPGILNVVGPPFVAEVRSDGGACFGALFDATRVHTPVVLRASEGRAP